MFLKFSCRNIERFLDTVRSLTEIPTGLIVLNYQEFEYTSLGDYPGFEGLVDYVNKYDIPMYIVNGSAEMPLLYDANNVRYRNVQPIIYWPTYYMTCTYPPFKAYPGYKDAVETADTLEFNQSFNHLFVSLNNRAHWHRCLQMDLFVKYDLLKVGAVSWNSWYLDKGRKLDQETNYTFKYWTPEIVLLDDLAPDDMEKGIGWGIQLPEQYKHAFVQVISESHANIPIISEKTVPCFLFNKLFLVSGSCGFHKLLKDMGFELYDEIFDYSFDAELDTEKRFDMLTQNLVKLKDTTEKQRWELYNKVRHKIVHNKHHFVKLATDINNIPELLLNMCKNNDPLIMDEDVYTYYQNGLNGPVYLEK